MIGLAQAKPEGMCVSYDDPSIKPWDGCKKEFDVVFKLTYGKFYHKPFLPILRKISSYAWDMALLHNAYKPQEIKINPPSNEEQGD